MKYLAHHIVVDTRPELYDLEQLLPDFRTINEFPHMLATEQLKYLGYANLIPFANALQSARDLLKRNIENLQHEIDDFDRIGPSCVKTIAKEAGCTWTNPEPHSPSQIAALPPHQRASCCNLPHSCHFGHFIAELCKPQSSTCQQDKLTTCGKTCTTCFVAKPFSDSACIFAENTEELIDTYIGELVGLENRYTDFVKQLNACLSRINRAKQEIAFSRPRFLRWRPKNYIHPGDHAIHFRIKQSSDGSIQPIPHHVVCRKIDTSTSSRFPNITYRDVDRDIKFTSDHTNRTLTLHDYKLLRKDLDFARIWLRNYSWRCYNEKDVKIQAALKQAFTKLLLT